MLKRTDCELSSTRTTAVLVCFRFFLCAEDGNHPTIDAVRTSIGSGYPSLRGCQFSASVLPIPFPYSMCAAITLCNTKRDAKTLRLQWRLLFTSHV